MKKFLVLILLVFSGCQLFESTDTENIDPELLGEWYMINTTSTSELDPTNLRVRGWSISSDGEMTQLGVVDSTGGIGLMTSYYQTRIISAENGKMKVKYTGHIDVTEDEVEYSFTPDHLIIDGGFGWINGKFKRTNIGNEVISPLPSTLQVKINGELAQNAKVANSIPTAFISKKSATTLKLVASLGGKMIVINIDNYDGSGTYTIGKEQAEYMIIGSDWVRPFPTFLDSSGTIFIDCDYVNSRCTGEFEFTTEHPDNNDGTFPILEDGSFDVPLLTAS